MMKLHIDVGMLFVIILEERDRRHFEYYMENFEWISNEAIKYWQKKGVNLTSIVRY
jgi:hypothetical protein